VLFSERRMVSINLSEAIDELVAVSPFLLEVIAPRGRAQA